MASLHYIATSPQHTNGPYQSPSVEATAGQAEPAVIRIKLVIAVDKSLSGHGASIQQPFQGVMKRWVFFNPALKRWDCVVSMERTLEGFLTKE